MSTASAPAATSDQEVAARLASTLQKLPAIPRTRVLIAEALAPTVAAMVAEATATTPARETGDPA